MIDNNNDDWVEVGNTPPTVDWDKEAEFVGSFVEKREGVGKNNSNAYIFERQDGGEQVTVWGSAILDDRLTSLQAGQLTKINYLGFVKSKDASGRSYKNYTVLKKPMSGQPAPVQPATAAPTEAKKSSEESKNDNLDFLDE